jgi:hypothetical protein
LFDSVNCPNSVKKTGKKRKAKYQEDKFNRYSPILKDLTEFLEQLSSLKFDKSLPLLIESISTFKANVLKKDRKLKSPIDKNKSKWGFVSQRSNKPTGRPRGRRGFLKFNKTSYDVSNLKSKAITKVKNVTKKIFKKRKQSASPCITKSDSLSKNGQTSKANNTSRDFDLGALDYDIESAIMESNQRQADEHLKKSLNRKKQLEINQQKSQNL